MAELTRRQPPLERPHRDKRRRTNEERPDAGPPITMLAPPLSRGHLQQQHISSYQQQVPVQEDERNMAAPPQPPYGSVYPSPQHSTARPTSSYANHATHESPYRAPVGMPGATASHINDLDDVENGHGNSSIDRSDHVTVQALDVGPRIREDRPGQRRIMAGDGHEIDGDQPGGRGGFTAVNQ